MSIPETEKNDLEALMRYYSGNRFSKRDYSIIQRTLFKIPQTQREIIYLRFWECKTLYEIGVILNLSEVKVDILMEKAFSRLRELCLKHPRFSRALMNTA